MISHFRETFSRRTPAGKSPLISRQKYTNIPFRRRPDPSFFQQSMKRKAKGRYRQATTPPRGIQTKKALKTD